MPQTLDVYRDWLGIKETNRPLNYYQIMRLKQFEDDQAKIREHYRKMNAHVRKYASGDFAKQSQELLNELSKAMLTLTDVRRKREYDATLGRKDTGEGRRRTLEEILLYSKVVDEAGLAKARTFANAIGVEVKDALVQQKLAKPETVMPAYAESLGLPYLDLADIHIDPQLVARLPATLARQNSCAPLMVDGKQLLFVAPNPLDPDVEQELRMRMGLPVRTILCTPAAITEILDKHFPREAAAAEMASGVLNRPIAQATPGGAAPTAAAPARIAASPELKKKRRLVGIMAFNFTFFLLMVLYELNFLLLIFGRSKFTVEGSPLIWVGILIIAGMAGGVGYSAVKK
jgi:hypothetical protein